MNKLKIFSRQIAIVILAGGIIWSVGYFFLSAAPSNKVEVGDDIKISLTGLPVSLYVFDGSQFDQMQFTSSSTMLVTMPATASFSLGSAANRSLLISPESASIDMDFNNSNIDSTGYITSWGITAANSTVINTTLAVPEADKDYLVKANGINYSFVHSSSGGQISFAYRFNGGSDDLSVIRQDHPTILPSWFLQAVSDGSRPKATTTKDVATSTSTDLNSATSSTGLLGPGIDNATAQKIDALIRSEASQIISSGWTDSFNQSLINRLYKLVISGFEKLIGKNNPAIANFISVGTPTTRRLGEGERAGVINSFKEAFGRLPQSLNDWEDVLRIANGLYPHQRNLKTEENAMALFNKIYLRTPDMENINDAAAVRILAYGLRPLGRNMVKEQTGIYLFVRTYSHIPQTAKDWDIVRAIAYSGASR